MLKIEKQLEDMDALVTRILEDELVDHYGMIRRCPLPHVDNGEVECSSEDRVPGTTCKALCAPSYRASATSVTCEKGGRTWSSELRCDKDVPLLVVSGGSDSTRVEVINFHNGTGCDLNIPDIPKTQHGEVRLMHNMFYFPGSPFKLLVCNGLSQSSKASCDSWTYGESQWKHHSYPNIDAGSESNDQLKALADMSRRMNMGTNAYYDKAMYHLSRSGRYAASSFSWDNRHFIVGGMLNEGNSHKPTNGMREYSWRWKRGRGMRQDRALFCIAQYNATNYVAIGGHSGKIEKSVEMIQGSGNIPDMQTARSGHACAGIEEGKILVAGGASSTHRSGGKALKTSEMYSADTNQWERVGDMVYERFGHALVNIGGRIIALGGKEWNPDVTLRNGEEFNLVTKTWSSIGDVMAVPRATFGYALIPHSAIPGCNIHLKVDGDIH